MLAQRMGCTLAELFRRMSAQEFRLHLQLEIERNPAPASDELIWQDG